MNKFILLIFSVLVPILVFPQLPEFMWASGCGNPPNTSDTKTSLATTLDGDFFLSGEFLDTVQFGNKKLVSAGGTDIFLAKHTYDGIPAWSIRIGGTDYDYVQKVLTGANGNVIVAGFFYGDTQIGQDQYSSYGSQDIFIASFNAAGTFQWSFRAGGPMADYITGLSLDDDQNILFGGYFYDTISFVDTTIISTRSSDIYLAKLSPDGDLQWVTTASGSSSDQLHSAYCDADGNTLVTGSFYYDITLGDTTLSTLNPVGVFVAKYQPDGQLSQVFQLDGTYLNTEVYIACGPEGDFYISGNFSEQLTFGEKTFDAGEFNQDIYLAKYDASCDLQWARHAHSYASDQVVGLVTDSYDNVFLAGHYLDTIHFELLTIPYSLCCGSREIFIVSYSASGGVLWGETISGTRSNIQSMALNGESELLLSGLFTEEVNFGPFQLSNFERFQNYISCLQTEVYTSVLNNYEEKILKLFPNPATDQIHVLTGPGSKYDTYSIYSIMGNLAGSGKFKPGDVIDIGNLPAGSYIMRLSGRGNMNGIQGAFVKQ